MKRIMIISFILSCSTTQPKDNKIPAVIYEMEGSQEAYGIVETHDRNYYIISGWTNEGGTCYPPRCMLLKVDKEGNLIQKKVFESLEWSCDAIVKTSNQNYLLRSNHYIVLMDDNLNILSKTYIPNSTPNFVVDIFGKMNDRIFMITSTDLGLPRGYHIYKFYQNALEDSINLYFNEANDVVSAVIEVYADGVYAVGRYISNDTSGYKFVKLNSNLDTILTNFIDVKSLFGYSAGYITAMEMAGDGTLIISAIIVRGFLDGFSAIFKVDTQGNLIKYDTISYSLASIDGMTKLNNGDIALVGSALKEGVFFTFVMRLKPDLSVVWYKEFVISNSVFYGTIIQDSNGDLVLAGYVPNYDDIAFMKLNPNTGEPLVWSRR